MIKENYFDNINRLKQRSVIYCRVSTREQVDEGNSLITQERLCRDYASRHNYEVDRIFIEEGESAKTTNRTKLLKMIEYCRVNHLVIDNIIVYSVDRLSRNTDDYTTLRTLFKTYKIRLESVTERLEDNPSGRFLEFVLAAKSQLDNEERGLKCRGGMIEGVRSGRYVFIAPFGYKNGVLNGEKNILIDEVKAKYIRRIFELLSTQLYSPEDVRKIITKEGARLGQNKVISKQYFHKIIRNKVYKGFIDVKSFNLGEIKGSFEPIVSEDVFDRVQLVLKRKGKRITGYKTNNPDFPLRGLIKSERGHKLDGSWSKGNAKEKMPYYRFRGLNGFNTRRDVLEGVFIDFIKKFEFKPEIINLLKKRIEVNWEYRNLSNKKLRSKIERNIYSLKEKQNQIIDKNLKSVINDDLAREQLEKISNEISNLSYELKNFEDSDNVAEVLNYGLDFIGNLSSRIKDLEIQQRKSLQWFLFPEGIIFDGKKLRTTRIPLILNTKKTSLDEKSSKVDLKGLEPYSKVFI
ncbi:MAG: recombinase family protein [Patescibacteria group bacterium]